MTNTNDLIEKYIYNVSKHLPKKIRQEVSVELESNIYDMLGPDFMLEEVESLLLELGDPVLLADNYRNDIRYVVSPKNYEQYMTVLKVSLIVVSTIFFFFGVIYCLQNIQNMSIVKSVFYVVFGSLTSGVLGLILAYAVITFAFQMLSLSNKEIKKEFTLESLIDIPLEKSYKISKNKVLTEVVVFSIIGFVGLFILIIYNSLRLFGIDFIFNKEVTVIFIPLFIVSIIMLIIKTALKMKMDNINYLSAIYDTVYCLYTGIVLILFALDPKLFHEDFYDSINVNAFNIVTITLSVVIGVIILLNISIKWYKFSRNA